MRKSQININLNELESIKCKQCNSPYFKTVQMIKKVSALISPNGKEQNLVVPVMRCDDCNEVYTEKELTNEP